MALTRNFKITVKTRAENDPEFRNTLLAEGIGMTSTRQDSDFIQAVVSHTLLEESIEWISSNLDPEDVFSENDLAYWATSNGYVED